MCCSRGFRPPTAPCAPTCISTGTDALVRAHLERALAHIREARIAVRERIQIRTVQELADQLTRIEQMREDLRTQQTSCRRILNLHPCLTYV